MEKAIEQFFDAGLESQIHGPAILWQFNAGPLGDIKITETILNQTIAVVVILIVAFILRAGMKQRKISSKQAITEILVSTMYSLVEGTMGKSKSHYTPYIATLMIFSAVSSLMSLFGLRPPTADVNVILTWSVITFLLIQYNKIKAHGILGYIKSFFQPYCVMVPLNIMSELATPVSLTLRHYSNIVAGTVITSLLYFFLAWLTSSLPIVPILQVGIPGFLSIYFDLFTSGVQAFVFCMLTMVFIAMGAED